MRDHALPLLPLVLVLGAVACGSSEQSTTGANPNAAPPPPAAGQPAGAVTVGNLRLLDIDLGRSVNPDHTMHDASSLFVPTDEVWASVVVDGTGPKATLEARWVSNDGTVIDKKSQEVTPAGRTVAAFGAEKPGGWPVGQYRVEMLLNGVQVGTKNFEVRQPPL
jgi:hypothetical protein